MHNIQTLIFDLGGVIINLKTEEKWMEEDLLPHFRPERLQQLQQQQYFQQFEIGKVSVPDFIDQLKDIAVNESIADDAVIHHWNGMLKDIPMQRVDLLKKLSEKYHPVLLSNTNHIHLDFIRKYMQHAFNEDILEGTFDACYYSHEIGLRKPYKEIFEFISKEQKLNCDATIFFDDKAENLYQASKFGIQTIQVNFNKLSINDLRHLL